MIVKLVFVQQLKVFFVGCCLLLFLTPFLYVIGSPSVNNRLQIVKSIVVEKTALENTIGIMLYVILAHLVCFVGHQMNK